MSKAAQALRRARALVREGASVQALVGGVLRAWEAATDDRERADVAHLLASFYRDIGDWGQAMRFGRQAIEAEQRAGRKALLGNHWMFLATLLRDTGRREEATRCAHEGLACYVETHGEGHSEVIYIKHVIRKLEIKR